MSKRIPFDELVVSTITFMAYTNVEIDLERLFTTIQLEEVEIPETKKKVERKDIIVDSGKIWSAEFGYRFRGPNLRKRKKKECPECQPCKKSDDGDDETIGNRTKTPLKTVVEVYREVDNDVCKETVVEYSCTNCSKFWKAGEKVSNFRNQVSVTISLGESNNQGYNPHVMIFKNTFKIAGCKTISDGRKIARTIFRDYIYPDKDMWKMREGYEKEKPTFVYRSVMRNVDFQIGFPINRERLNNLMNKKEYKDLVWISQAESTGGPNVNIKMKVDKKDITYDGEIFEKNKTRKVKFKECKYMNKKKTSKSDDEDHITFIVFSSSETILSGKVGGDMKKYYSSFLDIVEENRDYIEEKKNKRTQEGFDLSEFILG